MPGRTVRQLLLAVMLGSGLWLMHGGAASAMLPPRDAVPQVMIEEGEIINPSPSDSRPSNPDEGFQADDVREFVENYTIPLIVGAGLLILVVLWKWVSRPRRNKF